jgi:endonuclease YncB( thermonuclease family)
MKTRQLESLNSNRAFLWILIGFASAYSISHAWAGQIIPGKVVGITDGDTLTLLDEKQTQYRIRVSGIDTPERGQTFGHVASENLAKLAFGQLAAADCQKLDRYGRWVCVVRVNGMDVGLSQIKAGLAWHYKKYANEQTPMDRELYAKAEQEAKAAGIGLWKDMDPTPPWDWRKRR